MSTQISTLMARLKALGERFDARSKRERALIAAAAIGGIALIGFSLFVEPKLVRTEIARRSTAQLTGDAQVLESQLQALSLQLQTDPDAARKAEIARLRSELARVEGALRDLERGFVPPQRMNDLLERLLAGHTHLRLVSLKSLPPVNLADVGAAAKDGKDSVASGMPVGLYKHGVEVRITGTYADLYAYLLALERHDQKLLWGDVRLVVEEYPRAQMVIVVHTLGTDKAWLKL